MKKKLLFMEDLYDFYFKQNKNCVFSSKEFGYKLAVQIPTYFKIVVEEEEPGSLLYCKVKLMHSGENRNHSSVTDDALTKASKSLAYKPILANFMEYTDESSGEVLEDFTSHDFKVNDDGSITYYEKQIGAFTADEPTFEVEEGSGHNFLYAICAIPREYTHAASIIERKNGTKVSVEINVNELQYNAETKVLELTDIEIMGCTCLGTNPKTLEPVEEGMKNARLDIIDFSVQNNSLLMNYEDKLNNLQERLSKIENLYFNSNNGKKGGNSEMNKFKELLQKYGKTEADIEFEYEGLSDEELEAKFKEVFEENEDEGQEDPETDPEADPGNMEEDPENQADPEGSNFEQNNPNENTSFTKTFEISHEDIRYGLYNLLSIVEDADNDWYFISNVFDSYFVYENWDGTKIYGQSYTKNDDSGAVSFDGDRYKLYKELLTEEEHNQLKDMRSNYDSLVQFKSDTEKAISRTQKEELVNSEKYSVISGKNESGEYVNADFAALIKDMDNYSYDEFETKIKVIHSDFVSANSNFNLNDNSDKKKSFGFIPVVGKSRNKSNVSKNRYGDLFD